jgi:hypothetical protein
MDTDQVEQALRQRAGHHDAALTVEQLAGGGWQAAFRRPEEENFVVLSAEAATREEALQKLYESDELEDLRGG